MVRTLPRGLKAVLVVLCVLVAAAVAVQGLVYFKVLQINQWYVSDDAIVGVDVSNHQAEVNMQALADQGVQFVYIKATEGATYVDEYFDENWASAQAAGLPRGAYHFFSFDTPGADQAESFMQTVGSLDGCLIPVVDVEFYGDKRENPPAKEDVVRELQAYLDAIEAEYGVKPMIYSAGLYEDYLADDFGGYPRWVRSVTTPVWWNTDDDDWLLWQYSDAGRLEGSTGHEKFFDLNTLNENATFDQLKVGEW